MSVILDVIIVAVFVIALVWSVKRGFIKAMTGLISFVAALAVALWLSAPVAGWAYSTLVAPPVSAALEQVQTDVGQSAATSADAVLEGLPDGVRNLLTSVGISSGDDLTAKLSPNGSGTLIERVITDVIEPTATALLRMIAMLLLFLLTSFLVSLLLKVVDKVFKLPLLKGVNQTLGFIPGVLNGVVSVLLAVAIIQILCSLGVLITPEQIAGTAILSRLTAINPFVFLTV